MRGQICSDITIQFAESFTCRSSLYTAFSCALGNRPHPLPVQWLHVRHPDPISRLLSTTVNNAIGRGPVCSPPLFQAHLPLPSARLFRLSTQGLLLGQKIYDNNSMAELRAIGLEHNRSLHSGFWSFCVLGSDGSVTLASFSVLAWLVSRILGTQYLGHVLFHRSRLALW